MATAPEAPTLVVPLHSPMSDEQFATLCPLNPELRSPTDRLRTLQDKMREYCDNGARLGWLIDPLERVMYIYRPGAEVERLEAPEEVSGEPVLAEFVWRWEWL